MATISTIISLSTLLLIQSALAFIGKSTTSCHPIVGELVTSVSTPKSLHKARHNRRLTTFKFTHHNAIFQRSLALSSTTAENENERYLLSELLELTSSFEQIKETVQLNSRVYEEQLNEYEDKIRSLEADVSSSEESIRCKDAEMEASEKRSEDMERSVEEWGIERVTMAQRIGGLESELSERKVRLEEKEKELAIALKEQRRSVVEAEVDSSYMKALNVRLEEMENDATKRIEEVVTIRAIAKAAQVKQDEYHVGLDRLKEENEAIRAQLDESERLREEAINQISEKEQEVIRKAQELEEKQKLHLISQEIRFTLAQETRMSQESDSMQDEYKRLDEGKESSEDNFHQNHPSPPPPIKVLVASTTYELTCDSSLTTNQLIAHLLRFYITYTHTSHSHQHQNYDTPTSVSTALREIYNLDSFAQYIATALQGSCVFDYWTAELLGLPEYQGDIENAIRENQERYGWLVTMTKSGNDGDEGGERVTWAIDEEMVEMALEDMEAIEGKMGTIGRGDAEEAGKAEERRYFVGKR